MNTDKIKKILFLFIIFSYSISAKAQDLKLFSPIIISNLPNGDINGEIVNKVVLDYYNPDVNSMEVSFLKYNSTKNELYLFDHKKNEYKIFLQFKNVGDRVSMENFLGIFRYFNLIQKTDRCFSAKSAAGNYPSHIEKINTIEVLEKSQKYLILKINYIDLYDFKGYGVLVLQDFTK